MVIELTDITEHEIQSIRSFVEEQGIHYLDLYPLKVRESAFGESLGARNIIYGIKCNHKKELYAVDGGFLLDPATGKFSGQGTPQRIKAVYPNAPNPDVADKLHLYFVAKICEQNGSVPRGGADQLARVLDVNIAYLL